MWKDRFKFGRRSESEAARFLKQKGYKILRRNYRNRLGEIDLIALDKDTLVFVEVKARRSDEFGGPKNAVTRHKQKKIARVALFYLKECGQGERKARFDVVAISHNDRVQRIELIKNAFELA